ncbi:hypothetical protein CDAR_264201 [Caerostris darwini]|uniref:Ribosomal protein S10 n=1 Tax=Caerostris darwini TaxID=1538125 RepID=A0AAV4X182_9ARAC|nr:hypothetical protein CDAR_264201 [Caerostris darwini]
MPHGSIEQLSKETLWRSPSSAGGGRSNIWTHPQLHMRGNASDRLKHAGLVSHTPAEKKSLEKISKYWRSMEGVFDDDFFIIKIHTFQKTKSLFNTQISGIEPRSRGQPLNSVFLQLIACFQPVVRKCRNGEGTVRDNIQKQYLLKGSSVTLKMPYRSLRTLSMHSSTNRQAGHRKQQTFPTLL